ncbi:MAG TPA: DMT family transporter [Candidatus Ozemobacteraceae bacterium]|nr:DMT family transporter [Candidatus Ozemobacteraceae bacterium]
MNTRTTAYILITLVLWGLIPIFDKLALDAKKIPPFIGIGIRVSVAVLVLLPLLYAVPDLREGWNGLGARQFLAFAASGIISLIIAQYFYYEALRDSQVSKLFPLLFGGAPVVSMLLGWFVLGERISAMTAAGGVLITLGSVLLLL